MTEINRKIKDARPLLKQVAPLTFKICVGFGIVNLLISYLLFNTPRPEADNPLPLIGILIPFDWWGVLYGMHGLWLLYSLYINDWKMTRRAMISGLLLKTFWTYALFVFAYAGYPVFGTIILWLFLAWVQSWTIVHFLPVLTLGEKGGTDNDK